MAHVIPIGDMQQAVLLKLIQVMLDNKEPFMDAPYIAQIAISGDWQDDGTFRGYIQITDTSISIEKLFERSEEIEFITWVDYDAYRRADPVQVWWHIAPSPYTLNQNQENHAPYLPVLSIPA